MDREHHMRVLMHMQQIASSRNTFETSTVQPQVGIKATNDESSSCLTATAILYW